MRKWLNTICAAAVLMAFWTCTAAAWHLDGRVICDEGALPLGGVQVNVVSTDGGGFSGSTTTANTGLYHLELPNVPGAYRATLVVPNGGSVVNPASGQFLFSTSNATFEIHADWVVHSSACSNIGCWLTGGGAKYSAITGTSLGQIGIKNNFGGNVDGIPPGSTSPVTPFNFIEFRGTGTLKGIKGNKVDYGTVYFFGRCEDRNEPGSNGQRDGAGKDRYFLHVFSSLGNPIGTTLLLVDVDGNPATIDPVTITDGNLQIHVSSCSTGP